MRRKHLCILDLETTSSPLSLSTPNTKNLRIDTSLEINQFAGLKDYQLKFWDVLYTPFKIICLTNYEDTKELHSLTTQLAVMPVAQLRTTLSVYRQR